MSTHDARDVCVSREGRDWMDRLDYCDMLFANISIDQTNAKELRMRRPVAAASRMVMM